MAEEIRQADGDIAAGDWITAPLWSKIDEGSGSPDGTYIVCPNNKNSTGECSVQDPLNEGTYTGVEVRAYARKDAAGGNQRGLDGDIRINAGLQGQKTFQADLTESFVQYTQSWTGLSFTQGEMNSLQVLFTSTGDITPPPAGRREVHIDYIELVVTYTPPPEGGNGDWLPGWGYRKKITIDSTKVGANLSYFPTLISRIDADWKHTSHGGHVAQLCGEDIVFTASDGATKLNHEIEKYMPSTGELVAWVAIPSLLSATDTDIYIYYGNAICANQENVTATWDENGNNYYRLVQHLRDWGWSRYSNNPILQKGNPGDWDDVGVNWPYVIKIDSTYYMYYMGNNEIGLATGSDGKSFTKIADGIGGTSKVLAKGGADAWDEQHVASPAVIKVGATWYMFYTGRLAGAGAAAPESIGLATSSDGKDWTKHGGNPILTNGGIGWREVHLCHADIAWDSDNNRWVMLVSGMNAAEHETIGRYYCTDANFPDTWTEDGANPVINYGTQSGIDDYHVYHPRIYPSEIGGVWHIFYTAAQGADVNLSICRATTTSLYDGAFTKDSSNPAIDDGNKAWEASEVYTPAIHTKIDDLYYLYYTGKTAGGVKSIGLATADDISSSEDRKVEDSTSYSNDGTKIDPERPAQEASKIGDGQHLDGTGDWVNIADADSLEPANLTIEAWVNRDTANTRDAVLQKGTSADADGRNGYFMAVIESGHATQPNKAWGWICVANVGVQVFSTTALTAEAYFYIAVTYDKTNLKIYVDDGVAEGTIGENGDIDYVGGYQNVKIGMLEATGGGVSYPFDGLIDEVRISSVARSQQWLNACYANQNDPASFYKSIGTEEEPPAGEEYNETGKLITLLALLARSDQMTCIETGKSLAALAVLSRTDSHNNVETGRQVTPLAVVSQSDSQTMGEAGKLVTLLGQLSSSDVAAFTDTGLVTPVAVISQSDVMSMLETGKSQTVLAELSETDGMTCLETGRSLTLLTVLSKTDALTLGETGKTITALAEVAGADVASFVDSGLVVPLAVVSGADIMACVEGGRSLTVLAQVSGTDQFVYIETGRLITLLSQLSSSDVATFKDSGVLIPLAAVTGADALSMLETGRQQTVLAQLSQSDTMACNETARALTVLAQVTGTDQFVYIETGLLISLLAQLSASDVATFTDSGLVVPLAVVSGADAAVRYDRGKLITVLTQVTGSDLFGYIETGKLITVLAQLAQSDVLAADERNLVTAILSKTTSSDVMSMYEQGRVLTVLAQSSHTDAATRLETGKALTILAQLSQTDAYTMGETGKEIRVLAQLSSSDIAAFTDRGLVTILAVLSQSDVQAMGEAGKGLTVLAGVSSSDAAGLGETGRQITVLVSLAGSDLQSMIESRTLIPLAVVIGKDEYFPISEPEAAGIWMDDSWGWRRSQ